EAEQTSGRARMKMLLKHAKRVLDRHVITSKRRHARPKFEVQRVQWGCLQVRLIQSGGSHWAETFRFVAGTAMAAEAAAFAKPRCPDSVSMSKGQRPRCRRACPQTSAAGP